MNDKEFQSIINEVKNNIIYDFNRSDKTLTDILKMYNDYQENVRNGVDYIFNLNDKDDLACCVNGGLTASNIAELVLYTANPYNNTPYFFFGVNHPNAIKGQFKTIDDLKKHLISWLDEILPSVLAYPFSFESYKRIWKLYITNVFVNVL